MTPHAQQWYQQALGKLRMAQSQGCSCKLFEGELRAILQQIFLQHGLTEAVADTIARTCSLAEQDGASSHGLYRVPAYLSTLQTDWIDGNARPVLLQSSAAIVQADGANGFAQVTLQTAMPHIRQTLEDSGVCIYLARNTHHFGALWLDVEPFARSGLVALTMVNSHSHMASHGGRKPLYGTNPMAFAMPRAGQEPIVFDQASSVMAKGDVQLAAQAGRSVPMGTGLDRHGQTTDDPHRILDGGALLPFGGHKGSSIAMMVEVLAAALTGGSFSWEVDRSGHPGANTSRTGQFLLCIDPTRAGASDFGRRIEHLAQALLEHGQQRLPGDRRYALRRQAMAEGIAVEPSTLLDLLALRA